MTVWRGVGVSRLSHRSIVHRSQSRDQGGQEDRGKAGGGQRTEQRVPVVRGPG